MDFSQINKIGKLSEFLPAKKLSELSLKTDYKISDVRAVKTRFGPRIIVEVDREFTCFLPSRFTKVLENETLFQQMVTAARENNLLMEFFGDDFNSLEFKPAAA